jgi:hypothetical protein
MVMGKAKPNMRTGDVQALGRRRKWTIKDGRKRVSSVLASRRITQVNRESFGTKLRDEYYEQHADKSSSAIFIVLKANIWTLRVAG